MTPHCHTIQELLVAEFGAGQPWSEALEIHLRDCEACTALVRRLEASVEALGHLETRRAPAKALSDLVTASLGAQGREERAVRSLASLSRVNAPRDLEGRVVRACQAGFVEERALDGLVGMPSVEAPAALDSRVSVLFEELREQGKFGGYEAPEDLEQRVGQDIEDLPAAVSRQMLNKLPGLKAPEALRSAVDAELRHSAPVLRFSSRALFLTGLAAAASLALMMTLREGPSPEGQGEVVATTQEPLQPATLSFEVIESTDLASLSRRGRELAARVSGGLTPELAEMARVPVQVPEDKGLASQRVSKRANSQNNGALGSSSTQPGGSGGPGTSNSGGPGSITRPGGPQGSTGGSFAHGPSYFAGLGSAHYEVAYRGTRKVTIHTRVLDLVGEVVYTEEVASDGNGGFAIFPLNVVSPLMDWVEEDNYLRRQESRQGFFFRHRDFRIRKDARFWLNYKVLDLGQTQVIASRTCETFQFRRLDGTGNIFEVAVDPLTSLVMSESCATVAGDPVSEMNFNSFQLAADLSDLQLVSVAGDWQETDQATLPSVLAHEPLIPVAPPIGFDLQETRYLTPQPGSPQTNTWAQFVYGDGVEQVFFLFEDSDGVTGNTGPMGDTGLNNPDVIRSYSFGPWKMLEGHVRGRDVLSVGRVNSGELLLMLQSALE
ncbi:MAG: hypothetical protein ACI9F9_000894 [Candidatus Paceibacteria bacterium]|jgi:hypothetical protein